MKRVIFKTDNPDFSEHKAICVLKMKLSFKNENHRAKETLPNL